MADKADDIQQEINKGRQDIADTRSAITDKLAVLEDRVEATVYGVKHTFDLYYQVKQRPWLMFGGSVLVGCALGRRRNGITVVTPSEPSTRAQAEQSVVSAVKNQVQNELATIKGAAFAAVISTLWAMARQLLPAQPIDGAITKLGAQSIDRPQLTSRVIGSKTNGRHEP